MSPERSRLRIDTTQAQSVVSPLLFGHNLEHTRTCIWRGLSAELIRNRKLVGESGTQGVPMEWYPIGPETSLFRLEPSLEAYTRHDGVDLAGRATCDFSVQIQKIQCFEKGARCGLGQSDIGLHGKTAYHGFVAVMSDRPVTVRVDLTNEAGTQRYFAKAFKVQPKDWRELEFDFTMPRDDGRCRLEITFDQVATLHVGAVSLLPADNFHGLRPDVIGRLKEISVPMLRWPGGNFAGDYRWKDGLLPVHRRGGLKAFFDQTLRYTNWYDTHEIGTDEFIALCRELGAEPFISINISLETPQDAADWVEYCNGSPKTRWGKVRAQRGHPEPYNVKYWSLGNEMGYGHMKGPNRCDEYCKVAHECAQAMRRVDSGITLVASGTWFEGWIKVVPRKSYWDYEHVSFHWYVQPAVNDFLDKDVHKNLVRIARMPDTDLQRLQRTREGIDARVPRGRKIGIAYDEWNMWYAWCRRPLVVDAIYAAGLMHMLCRNAQSLGISMGAFFEPVNEGAILVDPSGCELTTIGDVFTLMKVHQGGRMVQVPYAGESDIDALATLGPDGRSLHVTLVNRSPDRKAQVSLDIEPSCAGRGRMIQLVPKQAAEPSVRYVRQERPLAAVAGKPLTLDLPRFSVTRLDLPLVGPVEGER